MDAMYLNLMFINPRPPVGAANEGARCTRPSLTPPPPAKNPGSAPAWRIYRHVKVVLGNCESTSVGLHWRLTANRFTTLHIFGVNSKDSDIKSYVISGLVHCVNSARPV